MRPPQQASSISGYFLFICLNQIVQADDKRDKHIDIRRLLGRKLLAGDSGLQPVYGDFFVAGSISELDHSLISKDNSVTTGVNAAFIRHLGDSLYPAVAPSIGIISPCG